MKTTAQNRLVSLDVFRGITIAAMILVNNPGTWSAIYPPLAHAKWHGCTPTDLIFPFFLFIVGVAITISLGRRKAEGGPQNKLIFQIVKRGFYIFIFGILLSTFPFFSISTLCTQGRFEMIDFSHMRIPGVLQRIGVVYIFASLIFLKFNIRWQAILGAFFLLLYWFLMTVVPVPGVGYPNLEPTTNLAAWLDNLLLSGHLWSASKVWDPEGILSTLPAISTALCGVMLGHWLKTKEEPITKTVWIFIFGNAAMAIGWLWDLVFPMNKSIWTSSYVVFTAGLALQFFGMCYWLIDIKGYKKWTQPFVVYGMNAITVFVASGFVARLLSNIKLRLGSMGEFVSLKQIIWENLYLPYFSPINASLAFALTYVFIWYLLMLVLYKKGIFLKV